MTSDRIDIICDDPHHARGKVAKMASFEYYADTDSWVECRTRVGVRLTGIPASRRHRGDRMWSERGLRFVTVMSANCAPADRGALRWNAPTQHCNGC